MSNVFVIGAAGYVGGLLARHLAEAGHHVSGLARSNEAADALSDNGITPVVADLDARMNQVVAAALEADATIYAAQVAFEGEPPVLRTLCEGLAGSAKTFVFLSGSGVFLQRTAGAWSPDVYAEDDPFIPEPLAASRVERSASCEPPRQWRARDRRLASDNLGPGDHGPVAETYRSVAATGAACYIGPGLAAYSNVHSADLARLFALVLERGEAGALYHAVGGEIPLSLDCGSGRPRSRRAHTQLVNGRSGRRVRPVRRAAAFRVQPYPQSPHPD